MTKADLIEEIARALKISHNDSRVILEAMLGKLVRGLRAGEHVELRGFGSFRTRVRGPRKGRNPRTGIPVEVLSKRVLVFKPSRQLKDLLNNRTIAIKEHTEQSG